MKKKCKNSRNIAIFHFLENCNFPRVFSFFPFFYHCFIIFTIFHHFLSFFSHSTTGSKNDKKMKKLEENCNFLFFGKFLHHWKQKWWKMKKWKKMKQMKIKIKKMKKKYFALHSRVQKDPRVQTGSSWWISRKPRSCPFSRSHPRSSK